MVKKQIRKLYTEKRNLLSEQEVQERTGRILDNFSSISLNGAQVLLSYYPIPEKREFDVSLCEQLHLLNNPLTRIAWPRLEHDMLNMEAIPVTKDSLLVKNRFGIFEPAGQEKLSPQEIDVVFVPLLAFDNKGYRAGYGKGYYDRYLSRCAQDVVKIGFSFFEALELISDINEFDVPLNYCITPTRVYEF